VGDATECAQALENLSRVFGLKQVHGQESVVRRHVQGWLFAGAEEVGDVLHLYKWHGRLLGLDAGIRDGQIYKPTRHLVKDIRTRKADVVDVLAQRSPVFQRIQQVARR